MKKILKWTSLIFLLATLFAIVTTFGTYLYFYKTTSFDREKLDASNLNIEVFDNAENIVREENLINHKYVKLSTLPEYVKQAFISTEDKNFYRHKGLDYKRMVKATLVNLKNMRFKQGASTISQQLIKNTHLSNEKTLERKFKEIAITKKMEKQLSKDEILEKYLNCIFFGNNCYGIESASNYYFSKSSKNLSPEEVAVLAGIISAPSRYSPTSNPEKAKVKRNYVLKNMSESGAINPNDYQTLISKDIMLDIEKTDVNKINSYSQMAIDEASLILGLPAKSIGLGGYKIHTYLNPAEQSKIKEIVNFNKTSETDISIIKIDSKSGAITAYVGTGNLKLSDVQRQPGSAIKPVLVYAPALEENKIYPCSIISDEEININGYSPNNVNKGYMGDVSVRTAVNKSLNTVAVKVLSYVGVENAKYYAQKAGIEFDKDDISYALALGGFKYGTTLKQLTNAYLPFANNGDFIEAKFVKYITDKNGKIIYKNENKSSKVFRDDTAYLMTDMLKGCVNFGTSKKLSSLPFEVAAKTGTVGTSKGNTDAYNISYTTDAVLGVWVGKLDNVAIKNLSGGNQPTKIAKEIYQSLSLSPNDFVAPNSVDYAEIDLLSLKDDKLIKLSNTFTPDRYKVKELFSKFNMPNEVSENFVSVKQPVLNCDEVKGENILSFEAKDYIEYELIKSTNDNEKVVMTCSNVSGKQEYNVGKVEKCSYYLVAKIKNFANNVEVVSNKSNQIKFYQSKSSVQYKPNDKWYI